MSSSKQHKVICAECRSPMVLRNSRHGLFYGCNKFPRCRGTHGAHPDGAPLGVPATQKTKDARIRAHDLFDRLWKGEGTKKERQVARKKAYAMMAREMDREEIHFGEFNEQECEEAIQILKKLS